MREGVQIWWPKNDRREMGKTILVRVCFRVLCTRVAIKGGRGKRVRESRAWTYREPHGEEGVEPAGGGRCGREGQDG